jgi:hypothetical protein
MSFWHDLQSAYEVHIVHAGKEQAFWLLVSFLVTFALVRAITHAIRADRGPFHNISVKGKHFHHLVPGIILVLISGYFAAALHLRLTRTIDAMVFGIGAALTLDEFALWLNLEDVYWAKQGRDSVDAVIIAAILLSLVVLGSGFWGDLIRTVF